MRIVAFAASVGKKLNRNNRPKFVKVFRRSFDDLGITTNYLFNLNPPSSAATGALLPRIGLAITFALDGAVEAS